jgi:hypothetical protein
MMRVVAALLILCAAAAAQVMTPNIVPPGGDNVLVPNQGSMTPNPIIQSGGGVITCQGTGYNFTLSCNSQYIVVL